MIIFDEWTPRTRQLQKQSVIPATSSAGQQPITTKSFIDDLPDELLLRIVELSVFSARSSKTPSWYPHDDEVNLATNKALTATSRRFYRIAVPFLYGTIKLSLPLKPASVRALQRNLRRDASLRRCCRTLHINIQAGLQVSKDDFKTARDIVAMLPEVRCATVHGNHYTYPGEIWALVASITASARKLRELTISRTGSGRLVPDVMNHVNSPSLEHLDIRGGLGPGQSMPAPSDQKAISSVTTLSFSNYKKDFESINQLIQWPKALEHFRFGGIVDSPSYMDLTMFGHALAFHKHTLRSIDIGPLSRPEQSQKLLDFSDFSALESLRLSRFCFTPDLDAAGDDAARLLAPGLRRFAWDFCLRHEGPEHSGESWHALGGVEEAWLLGFAAAAAARRVPLAAVNVVFNLRSGTLYNPGWVGRSVAEASDPWDILDRAGRELRRRFGVALEYNPRLVDRKTWDMYMDIYAGDEPWF